MFKYLSIVLFTYNCGLYYLLAAQYVTLTDSFIFILLYLYIYIYTHLYSYIYTFIFILIYIL